MGKREYAKNLSFPILFLILFAGNYWRTFLWMHERFLEESSFYLHGYLVPFVSFFLLKSAVHPADCYEADPRDRFFGGIVLCFAVLLNGFSVLVQIYFLGGLSFVFSCWGLTLFHKGRAFFRKALPALLFLFFMVPLPNIVILSFSFYLRFLSTQVSVFVMKLFGLPVFADGNVITFIGKKISIGEPCSGLRSIISFFAFSIFLGYSAPISRAMKALLFILSFPLSIFLNIVRIILIVLLSTVVPVSILVGPAHFVLGLILYCFGVIFYLLLVRFLSRDHLAKAARETTE